MIVSCTTFCQACPLTIMAIDRDHPPDPTYLQKLRPATRERGQLSARSDGSSRSMSPGRCVVDGWDKRGEVTWRTYDDRSASSFSLLSFNGRVPDRMGRKRARASAGVPIPRASQDDSRNRWRVGHHMACLRRPLTFIAPIAGAHASPALILPWQRGRQESASAAARSEVVCTDFFTVRRSFFFLLKRPLLVM